MEKGGTGSSEYGPPVSVSEAEFGQPGLPVPDGEYALGGLLWLPIWLSPLGTY